MNMWILNLKTKKTKNWGAIGNEIYIKNEVYILK